MSIFKALVELEERNEVGALCTIIRSQGSTPRGTGSKMLVYRDRSIEGTVGGGELENRVIAEAINSIQDGQARSIEYSMANPERGDPGVCGGSLEVFVEPLLPKPTLIVIGAGHVGKAVAYLAHWLDFYVVVNDDRTEFCNSETVPDADRYLPGPMEVIPQKLEINPWTYLVLTTRGSDIDIEGLPAILDSEAAYIGVIGSRRRWATARKQILKKGIAEDTLEKVYSPIGLELNAETPEEIAVSILAEIIMLRQGGDGSVMSGKSNGEPDVA